MILWPWLLVSLAAPAGWDSPAAWHTALVEAGITAHPVAQIDLGRLPAAASLALLRADKVASPEGLRRFVQAGGRVLLAVEGPQDDPTLEPFELRAAPPPALAGIGQHPALIEVATPNHGLFRGVQALVTNHPTAVHGPARLKPALTFSDGTPFAWQLRLGDGELVVVGDSSLFIDLMRPLAGNGRFADAVGAWLGADGRPVYLVTGPLTGDGPQAARPSPQARLNDALAELAGGASPGSAWIALFAALAAAAGALVAWTRFPGDRRPL
ncbi:MAG: hypothetical protein KC613_28220, partial [Myxococcales bacterium]|nr:hypothetical protein [Myxococcales bacterium]